MEHKRIKFLSTNEKSSAFDKIFQHRELNNMSKRQIISPISIDLGAKNTGVYFAHYEAGSSIEDIEKDGKVYELAKDSFTLMMTDRTAKRHQRRGYKRRQMVKRLFRLIWCHEFGLEWNDEVQQSISFLFNRRGFSFLTEEYDVDVLKKFPEEVFEKLPVSLQDEIGDARRIDEKLLEWKKNGLSQVENMFNLINEKPKETKHKLELISQTERLQQYCETRISDDQIGVNKSKNKRVFNPILDAWNDMGIANIELIREEQKSFDLAKILNQQPISVAREIRDSIPSEFSRDKRVLNSSVWNFNATIFNLEKANFESPESSSISDRDKWIQSHIHHFAFALHKVRDELNSGARHRSKYFEEIEEELNCQEHVHGYLNTFCTRLHANEFTIKSDSPLTPQSLSKLIGHLSNLELKPLRKYFRDKRHKHEDYWDRERFKKIFNHWILKDWRVNPKKDLDKGPNYRKLRFKLTAYQGDVIDFLLQESPSFTIPPYQDNNNRRPPKCQSLILNKNFLDKHYSSWRTWLDELLTLPQVKDYLADYIENMKSLKSGKKFAYFNDEVTRSQKSTSGCMTEKDLEARVLQFVLDRVKDEDVLHLNDIFSRTKKIRQQQSTQIEREKAKNNLNKAMISSQLPEKLKTSPNYQDRSVFGQGSFLHLVCKYYKIRQNARDGRIFIHPEYRYVRGRGYENTGRFEDQDHLLTYCNKMPRQKRHQIFSDVASLFQLPPQQLRERTNSEKDSELANWFGNFNGLMSNCAKATKMQKEYRGRLKEKILEAHYKEEENTKHELLKLAKKSKELCEKIGDCLYDDESQREHWRNLTGHPASAVFLLIQINNVVFKERRGNAKTCSVCSLDNSERMQFFNEGVRAQRLPSIPTRPFDGSVMRLARIVCNSIANDKWNRIETDLKDNNSVRIPIITESNKFEFEPNLENLKGRKPDNLFSNAEKSQLKKDRIKKSASCSPYSGKELGNEGDLDHIIRRNHPRWGTLNDEANLIFTSVQDNRTEKGESEYSLSDLHQNYKQQVFESTNDSQIEKQIKEEIGNGLDGHFKFGRYFNFTNLTDRQQVAFRHALFLHVDDPLRELVLNSINHRIKTYVNGTQRYFAEVLANTLYKKARKINKHHLLSFDYFSVQAQEDTRGDGVYNLRQDLVTHYRHDLNLYSKDKGSSQDPYSHLLDAQVAFCMIADAHRDSGGLRLELGNAGIWGHISKAATDDAETSVPGINDGRLFNAIQVDPKQFQGNVISLKRRKPDRQYFAHRSIHRDGMYADHYLPILVHCRTSEVRIGFNWKNSFELKDSKVNREKLYFALQFNPKTKLLGLNENDSFNELKQRMVQVGFGSNKKYFCISLNKQIIHSYYIENYNTSKGHQPHGSGMRFLRKTLSYRTENKPFKTLDEAKEIFNTESNFQLPKNQQHSLTLPLKNEWSRLIDNWMKSPNLEDGEFLRIYFKSKFKQPHQKLRQVYSLPVKSNQGHVLLKRNSWNNKPIFQIVNDSDSRKIDAKAFIPICNRDGDIGKLLSGSAKSQNVFLLNDAEYCTELTEDVKLIEPDKWYELELNNSLEKLGIAVLKYRIDNNTRPLVRIEFCDQLAEKDIGSLLADPLLKPKEKAKVKQELQIRSKQGNSEPIEYTGSGFSSEIRCSLKTVLQQAYFPENAANTSST